MSSTIQSADDNTSGVSGPARWRRSRRHRGLASMMIVAAATAALVVGSGPAQARDGHKGHDEGNAFKQVNLVSDIAGLAQLTDPDVKNPWGIDFGPQTPLWSSNQNSNTSTVYAGANAKTPKITKLLRVEASSPTGIVFNPTNSFRITQGGKTAKANFIFDENLNVNTNNPTAEISAWSNASAPPPPPTTVVKATKPGSLYFGLALVPATHRRGPRLLAADGINGTIDVYNGRFQRINVGSKAFVDADAAAKKLPPYNVTYLNGRVYVSYASFGRPEAAVSVFKPNGKFIKRLVTDAPLAGPWGMTIAPHEWGEFGGALLVGNVDDGRINAFNRHSGKFLGAVSDAKGAPLVNPGLWGLKFGNGIIGTPHTLLFAAGIGEAPGGGGVEVYEHGLIGAITPVEKDNNNHS